jgi:hypothetical protein
MQRVKSIAHREYKETANTLCPMHYAPCPIIQSRWDSFFLNNQITLFGHDDRFQGRNTGFIPFGPGMFF